MKNNPPIQLPAVMACMMLMMTACAAGKVGNSGFNYWPAGTLVTYEMTNGQTQTMELPGRGERVTTAESTFIIAVESTGEREVRISVIDATTTAPSLDVEPLIGVEGVIRLDERGQIVETSGLEDNEYIENRGGIELFVEDLQSLFFYLPENTPEEDTEWTRHYSVSAYQNGIAQTRNVTDTYRCTGETEYEGSPALGVDIVSRSESLGNGEIGGMPMDLKLSGRIEGKMYVDPSTGMIVMREMHGNLRGGMQTDQFEIPMTISISMAIRIRN